MYRFRHLKDETDPFSFVPISDAGKTVVKELVVVQSKVTHKYELFYKKDLECY